MKVVGIIPARYGSTRLPGKPLMDICGKPMIQRVFEQASKARNIDEIFVATDDEMISDVCKAKNIPVVMTSSEHPTGANRLQEVSQMVKADFYVQINGDEPLIDFKAIEAVIPADVPNNCEFGTNIITKIQNPAHAIDASNIKMVFDNNYHALYMSRTPIPYPFKDSDFQYYKHVGIIGYNKKMLDFYANSTPGRQEKIEGIDTLRFLDYGKTLQLIEVKEYTSLSVDTLADLEYVRKIIGSKE